MTRITLISFGAALAAMMFAPGCGKSADKAPADKAGKADKGKVKPTAAGPTAVVDKAILESFGTPPSVILAKGAKVDPAHVALGRKLYFDKRLSKAGDLSCNSCHDLKEYGVDVREGSRKFSIGHKGQKGGRNAPTVYYAAGHLAQFWDGRSPHVEHQATQPVINPVEMAMTAPEVVTVLKGIPGYVEEFGKAFGGGADTVTFENMGKAIGAFERGLVTPSRWDKFQAGDDKALTDAEKIGFNTFIQAGCPSCHMGPLLGATTYEKLGAVKAWPNQKDLGRFDVTKADVDKLKFKVPSLRNVLKTAPYFHDSSADSIEDAIKLMATHQLGKTLTDVEVKAIVAWFGALTGDLPTKYIAEPELPKTAAAAPAAPAVVKPTP